MNLPCGFCGWLTLDEHEDGALFCRECCFEWKSRDEYLTQLLDEARSDFQHADPFFKIVLGNDYVEHTLRRVAARLFALRVPANVIQPLLHGVNAAAKAPLTNGQVEEILIEQAVGV